jgi:uncharacterized protein with PhoU and TrkA domain
VSIRKKIATVLKMAQLNESLGARASHIALTVLRTVQDVPKMAASRNRESGQVTIISPALGCRLLHADGCAYNRTEPF